jgi:predicted ATP-grasp superfamily ATP-dependent carboligase
MGRVFVLNAHATHALVSIRCLGARGLSVTAGSSSRWSPGGLSRYAERVVRHPSPADDPDGFVRAVERELRTGEYDMLLPMNEVTVETVVKHRDRFEEHTNVPFLPYERLSIALDKRRTIEAAREFDVPHPKTLFDDEADVDGVESALGYPVVVKPRRGSSRRGVSVCRSRAELNRAARRTRAEHGPVLFQEFVPHGGERGVYTLYGRSGDLTALTVQERIRSNPPAGGASTYRETVADPELVELADGLLTELDWQGLAMVEFRVDERSGEPQLMEINPRLWGSLALSVFAGADFPFLLYRMAVGDDPEPDLEYDVGVRARCLFSDARQVLARDDRLAALREFLTPATEPCRYDIVSRSDPLPTLGQCLYWGECLFDRGAAALLGDDDEESGRDPAVRSDPPPRT